MNVISDFWKGKVSFHRTFSRFQKKKKQSKSKQATLLKRHKLLFKSLIRNKRDSGGVIIT